MIVNRDNRMEMIDNRFIISFCFCAAKVRIIYELAKNRKKKYHKSDNFSVLRCE